MEEGLVRTKSGKRTAHFRVQIVEEGNQILLFFDGHDIPPLSFSSTTGSSGAKAHAKLQKILDAEEPMEPAAEKERTSSTDA